MGYRLWVKSQKGKEVKRQKPFHLFTYFPLCLFVFLSFYLSALLPIFAGSWESRGIGGGGAFYSASINPHNSQVIYIASDMTGVYRTNNFGISWETLDFKQLQGGVDTNVCFTSGPSILYALQVTGDDLRKPAKSVDGGTTWTPLTNDPTYGEVFSLRVDPNSTERLFVTTWTKLYFSNDGGANFNLVYTTPNIDGGLHIAGVFWDGSNIFIGTQDGLLFSSNGGANFTLLPYNGIPFGEYAASFAGAKEGSAIRFFVVTYDSVFAGMTGGEVWNYKNVYRLDWGQGNWTKKINGIQDCDHPFFVGMALNDVDVAYLAGAAIYPCFGPIVYKTTDGGNTWNSVFLTDNNQNIATGWSGSGGDEDWWYGEYVLGFSVCPNNPNRVIITDLGFAHVTDDGGANWRQAYVESVYENPAGSPTPKGNYYRGNGLEDTSSWWLHWTGQSTIIGGFSDISGIRSIDNGQTWAAGSSLGLPHNSTYCIIEHPTTGKLYAATSSVHDLYESTYLQDSRINGGTGYVVVSNDEGQTWQTLKNFGHPVVWLTINPDDTETMYASVVHSSLGGIFVTHNLSAGASATWTKLSNPPRTEGHPYNIHVLNDGTLVATYSGRRNAAGAFTQSSGVFLSTDGGNTWIDRSDPKMVRWTKDIVIDPNDPNQNTWYAAVFSHWGSYPNEVGGLYRTTNRGQSWSRISGSYRVESAAIHPDNPNVLYFSTEVEGLWRTDNLNVTNPTFTQVGDYPFRHPVRIFFNPSNHNEVWVTNFGGGLWVYTEGGGTTTTTTSTTTTTLVSTTTITTTTTSTTTTTVPEICRTCPTKFRVTQGSTKCKPIWIWNCGGGTLSWTVSEGCNWLTLSPSNGTSTGENVKVTACVNTAGMAKGDYQCTVTITGEGASNSPLKCIIRLRVK